MARKNTDPADTFDGGYHIYAKEKHKERVAKNSERIEYAIEQFEKHNIECRIKIGRATAAQHTLCGE